MSSSSCHRTCLLGCRCLAHAPLPSSDCSIRQGVDGTHWAAEDRKTGIASPARAPLLSCLGVFRLQGERTSCFPVCSVPFRFDVSPNNTRPSCSRSRAETQGDSASAGVCTHSPRARTVWPVDAQWGAEQDCCCTARETCFPGLAGGLFPIRATAMNSRMGVWIGWVTRQSNDRIFEQWQEEGRARQVIIRAGDFQQWVANRRISCSVGDKSPVVG